MTAQVFTRAAELIEQGWTQGAFGRRRGEVVRSTALETADCLCAMGAIKVGAGIVSTLDGRMPNLIRQLAQAAGLKGRDALAVHDWNDADDRTQAEVAAALRKAARLKRAA